MLFFGSLDPLALPRDRGHMRCILGNRANWNRQGTIGNQIGRKGETFYEKLCTFFLNGVKFVVWQSYSLKKINVSPISARYKVPNHRVHG